MHILRFMIPPRYYVPRPATPCRVLQCPACPLPPATGTPRPSRGHRIPLGQLRIRGRDSLRGGPTASNAKYLLGQWQTGSSGKGSPRSSSAQGRSVPVCSRRARGSPWVLSVRRSTWSCFVVPVCFSDLFSFFLFSFFFLLL